MAENLIREHILVSLGPSEDVDLSSELSKGRTFGHDMRRLVKLVCRAFLNPSELNNITTLLPF
jgi:hypothetical protein